MLLLMIIVDNVYDIVFIIFIKIKDDCLDIVFFVLEYFVLLKKKKYVIEKKKFIEGLIE